MFILTMYVRFVSCFYPDNIRTFCVAFYPDNMHTFCVACFPVKTSVLLMCLDFYAVDEPKFIARGTNTESKKKKSVCFVFYFRDSHNFSLPGPTQREDSPTTLWNHPRFTGLLLPSRTPSNWSGEREKVLGRTVK